MTWLKVSDDFPEHPKVDALSDGAFRLHVAGLAYAARSLTDGFIPAEKVARLVPRFRRAHLTELIPELWHLDVPCPRCVDGDLVKPPDVDGFYVHDFLAYNPTGDQVRAKRDQEAEKKRKQRARGAKATTKGAGGRFTSRRESPGDISGDDPGESPATRTRTRPPSGTSSSSSPRAMVTEEEEDDIDRRPLDAARVLAERALAARSDHLGPIAARERWLTVTSCDRLEQHSIRIGELLAEQPDLTAVALADLLEPDLAPPAPPRPPCTTCEDRRFVFHDGNLDAHPCPECS